MTNTWPLLGKEAYAADLSNVVRHLVWRDDVLCGAEPDASLDTTLSTGLSSRITARMAGVSLHNSFE